MPAQEAVMARVPLLYTAITGMMLVASPLASATDNEAARLPAVAQAFEESEPEMAMCGARNDVLNELAQQFREKPMAVGQIDNNAVLEILVSDTGSWTILATGTDGQSCIVSTGEGFQSTMLVRGVDA
jgi:hypothetical protein